jgi:hypothetical protein
VSTNIGYLVYKYVFVGLLEIRQSGITITELTRKKVEKTEVWGRDKMRLEDTTERINGRLLSRSRVLPLLRVYTQEWLEMEHGKKAQEQSEMEDSSS